MPLNPLAVTGVLTFETIDHTTVGMAYAPGAEHSRAAMAGTATLAWNWERCIADKMERMEKFKICDVKLAVLQVDVFLDVAPQACFILPQTTSIALLKRLKHG
jgi:hypothetical protein